MGIFRRRKDGDLATTDEPVARDRVVEDRRGDWGGPPLVRALFTLLGVGTAGLLIWLAHYFDVANSNEFWAAMGLIAAAGLVLGLSQLVGGWTKWGVPIVSPGVFLFAFIFDTTGPRRREVVERERELVADEDVHDYDRGDVVTTPASERTVVRDRTAVPAGDVRSDEVVIDGSNRRTIA